MDNIDNAIRNIEKSNKLLNKIEKKLKDKVTNNPTIKIHIYTNKKKNTSKKKSVKKKSVKKKKKIIKKKSFFEKYF